MCGMRDWAFSPEWGSKPRAVPLNLAGVTISAFGLIVERMKFWTKVSTGFGEILMDLDGVGELMHENVRGLLHPLVGNAGQRE